MKRGTHGELRFYLGRGLSEKPVDFGDELIENGCIQNLMEGTYGRPDSSISQLCGSIIMQNYTHDELCGKHPFVSASANRLIESLHRPDGRDITEDEAIREAGKDKAKYPPQLVEIKNGVRKINLKQYMDDFAAKTRPPKKNFYNTLRKHTPMKFAAWMTDVFHEVRRLGPNSRRVVMTYKLLRNNYIAPIRVPREAALVSKLELMVADFHQFIINTSDPKSIERGAPKTFGFILRHCYPLMSLAEPWKCLKNVDAVLYHILSARYACVLAPVCLMKWGDVGVPFCSEDDNPRRTCFLTSGFSNEVMALMGNEDCRDHLHQHAPLITRVEWLELGFGNVCGANGITGNWDCGKTWSYQTTVLVCLIDRSSRWERRRVAFLIQEKGYKGNMFQKIGQYYPIFRNVCYFL